MEEEAAAASGEREAAAGLDLGSVLVLVPVWFLAAFLRVVLVWFLAVPGLGLRVLGVLVVGWALALVRCHHGLDRDNLV